MIDTVAAAINPIKPVRFILHVGPGIGNSVEGMKLAGARSRLTNMMESQAASLVGAMSMHASMALPDALVAPRKATLNVMKAYSTTAFVDGAVFSVAVTTHSIVSALINCVVDAGLAESLMICLHHEDPSEGITTHQLDSETRLIDWPYGVLDSEIDKFDLRELGFQISH